MRAVLQRVTRAEVRVDGVVVGAIAEGLCVLLAVREGDGPAEAAWMADRIRGLRIFEDTAGKMNLALADQPNAAALVVSQFTLYGDASKGRRPSFNRSARPEVAEPLYRAVCEALQASGVQVERGVFGASMEVALVNSGPVTLILDSPVAGAAV